MNRSETDDGSPLEEIADELYTVRPDEFVAARDERERAARAAGDRSLAREIARLRRPTQSAWLVNLLWRDQQEVMEELFGLADEFRAALGQGTGTALQELTAQRRAIESALAKRARVLADQAGVKVSTDLLRETQETLAAALSDPEVAAEVRTGRLVKPASYSGFGGAPPNLRVVPGGRSAGGDQGETERAAAERRLRDAHDALAEAEAELADRAGTADEAERHHAGLAERVARLQAELAELEQQARAAADTAKTEARRRDRAAEAVEQARAAVREAEQQLG